MHIRPNRIESARQAHALAEGRGVITRVDEVFERLKAADNGPQDLWAGEGEVLATRLTLQGSFLGLPPRKVRDGSLTVTDKQSVMEAEADFTGYDRNIRAAPGLARFSRAVKGAAIFGASSAAATAILMAPRLLISPGLGALSA